MYDAVLFVHVVGVVLLVIGLGYSLGGLVMAQGARDVGGVRRALTLAPLTERIMPVAMLLIVAAGLYLAARHGDDGGIRWDSGWLDVAFALFALMGVLGPAVEGKRVMAIHQAAEIAGEGPLTPELARLLSDRVLSHVATFGACQVGAFLWLMTNKPALASAVITAVVAGVASVPLGQLLLRRAAGATAVTIPTQPARSDMQRVVSD